MGKGPAPGLLPHSAPSNVSQLRLTITNAGQYLQHEVYVHMDHSLGMLERDTHTHTHVHPRESERREHARTSEKIKMALPSVCGMTSAQGGGSEEKCVGGGDKKGGIWDECGEIEHTGVGGDVLKSW